MPEGTNGVKVVPSANLGVDKDKWNSWGEGKVISITDMNETGARHSVGCRLTVGRPT